MLQKKPALAGLLEMSRVNLSRLAHVTMQRGEVLA
jgi:hypothetical protein